MNTNEYKIKPWELCCGKLYPEDIWTPDHFRTKISDWFPVLQEKSDDEDVECNCPEMSETIFGETISSVEKIFNASLSGCEIVPCFSLISNDEDSSSLYSSKNFKDCCLKKVLSDEEFKSSDSDEKLKDDKNNNDNRYLGDFCELKSKNIEEKNSLLDRYLGNLSREILYEDKKICDNLQKENYIEKSNFCYCENFKRSNSICRNNDSVSICGSMNSCESRFLNSESKSLSSGKKEEEKEPIDRRLENQVIIKMIDNQFLLIVK